MHESDTLFDPHGDMRGEPGLGMLFGQTEVSNPKFPMRSFSPRAWDDVAGSYDMLDGWR